MTLVPSPSSHVDIRHLPCIALSLPHPDQAARSVRLPFSTRPVCQRRRRRRRGHCGIFAVRIAISSLRISTISTILSLRNPHVITLFYSRWRVRLFFFSKRVQRHRRGPHRHRHLRADTEISTAKTSSFHRPSPSISPQPELISSVHSPLSHRQTCVLPQQKSIPVKPQLRLCRLRSAPPSQCDFDTPHRLTTIPLPSTSQ